MKLVDCFIFYNEMDLLTYRLNLLNGVVDHFVLVEATRTFAGNPKPLHYAENQKLFEAFRDKITHVVVDDFPFPRESIDYEKKQQWLNETCQRNAISRGLEGLALAPDDLILVTDVDEIPDRRTLEAIKAGAVPVSLNVLEMDFYYYNLRHKFDSKWQHAKIVRLDRLTMSCDDLRQLHCRQYCNNIQNGGWHLSYFGDAAYIQNKIKNFSHQELNLERFTDLEKIEKRVREGGDLYDRNNDLRRVELDCNPNLPLEHDAFLKMFY